MQPSLRTTVSVLSIAIVPLSPLLAQHSNLAVSPFVSFLPSGGANPLAGLALTLGGASGFAVRGSANFALGTSDDGPQYRDTIRPWGADADAMFLFGGASGGGGRGGSSARSVTPFVFVGMGSETNSDAGFSQTTRNWSYGAGASVPVGPAIDLFGEGRWRMSEFVLPTARDAVSPTTELRFGVSFHVGTNSSDDGQGRRGRRSASSW